MLFWLNWQHLQICFKKFNKFFTKDISLSRTFYRFTIQCNDDELWSLWWWWWWWCIENDDDDDDDECWRSFFLFHSSAFSSELGRLGKRSTDNCVDCRDCDNSDESCNFDYNDHDDLEIVVIVMMAVLNLYKHWIFYWMFDICDFKIKENVIILIVDIVPNVGNHDLDVKLRFRLELLWLVKTCPKT